MRTSSCFAVRLSASVSRIWVALGRALLIARDPDPATDLDDLFLFEAKRRVMKDRTVSLHGRLYEVDAVLLGQTVTLRYDPEAPPSRPIEVVHDAQPAGVATSMDSTATNSTPTSPTACVWPAASSPCSNPPPSKPCSRARAGCPGSSTGSPTTP